MAGGSIALDGRFWSLGGRNVIAQWVTVRLASQTAELLLAQILRNESCSR